ncbi:MAG: hypothetical protein ACOC42_02655 [Halobacteriota archaeon]
MSEEQPDRSRISDELGVPEEPPTASDDDHILPLDDLRYPTITFPEGSIDPVAGINLSGHYGRDDLRSLLADLDGALTSHDLCLESPDRRVTFGIGPGDVSVDFEPDEQHLGRLEITLSLRAKALTYAEADDVEVGARGGLGFIPKAMLTGDIEPGEARCYNWIDDPTAGLSSSEAGDGPDED